MSTDPLWLHVDGDRLLGGVRLPAELSLRITAWLQAKEGRSIGKEEGRYSDGRIATVCVLIDRTVERRVASPVSWEDAIRAALTVAAWADFFETRTGKILPPEGVVY